MHSFIIQYTDKDSLERVFDGPVLPTMDEALLTQEKLEREGHIDVIIGDHSDIELDIE